MKDNKLNRRDFLRAALWTGAVAGLAACTTAQPAAPATTAVTEGHVASKGCSTGQAARRPPRFRKGT